MLYRKMEFNNRRFKKNFQIKQKKHLKKIRDNIGRLNEIIKEQSKEIESFMY